MGKRMGIEKEKEKGKGKGKERCKDGTTEVVTFAVQDSWNKHLFKSQNNHFVQTKAQDQQKKEAPFSSLINTTALV